MYYFDLEQFINFYGFMVIFYGIYALYELITKDVRAIKAIMSGDDDEIERLIEKNCLESERDALREKWSELKFRLSLMPFDMSPLLALVFVALFLWRSFFWWYFIISKIRKMCLMIVEKINRKESK